MQAGTTTDGAVREWRPPYPVDPAGVLSRCAAAGATRPGTPRTGRPSGGPGRPRTGPRRRGSPAAATAPSSCTRGGRARRGRSTGCPNCWATATTRPRSSPTTRWWPTRTGGSGVPVLRHPPGVGRPGARRAGAEGHGHRGPPVVARAVPAFGDPAPGPAPAGCGSRRPRQMRAVPDWDWHRAGSTPRGGGRSAPARRWPTGWRTPATLGGEPGRAAARVPGHRGVDRGRGRPARVGDPDAVTSATSTSRPWSAGPCSAARSTTTRC